MKKMFLLILATCISFVFVACTSALVEDGDTIGSNIGAMGHDAIESDDAGGDSFLDENSHEPPSVLYFDSLEEIAELKAMIDEDDENKIYKYLTEKNFYMNGLSSQEDIVKIFAQIGDLTILHLDDASGYKLTGIAYYVDFGYVMSTYRTSDDMVRFYCYIKNESDATNSVESSTNGSTVTNRLTVANEEIALHKVTATNSPFSLQGSVDTSNSHIDIRLTNEDQDTINDVNEHILLSTLNELIQ